MHLLFLVDTDPERDPRVRHHLDDLRTLGATIEIVVAKRRWLGGLAALFDLEVLGFLVSSVRLHGAGGFALVRRLRRRIGPRYGLRWRVLGHSLVGLNLLLGLARNYRKAVGPTFDAVVANDLYCGIAGLLIARRMGVPLIYDSHELQPFRNLRNSYTRIFLAYCLERSVTDYARAIFVVSRPIACAYASIYRPKHCLIIENRSELTARYASSGLPITGGGTNVSLVYFGSLQRGRGLSYIPAMHAQTGAEVHLFAVHNSPLRAAALIGEADTTSTNWLHLHEALHDLSEVRSFVGRDAAVFSLSLLEDICLNYRFALPNKLFESLANGFPLICLSGTYVASVVSRHRLGIVVNERELRDGRLPQLIQRFIASWPEFLANADRFLARRRYGQTYRAFWQREFGPTLGSAPSPAPGPAPDKAV